MSNYKYEEAYSSNDEKLIDLDELIRIDVEEHERYLKDYKGKTFCPECKVPKLTLAHRDISTTLKRIKNDNHINCSIGFEEPSKKINNIFAEEAINNPKQIQKKLQYLLDSLINKIYFQQEKNEPPILTFEAITEINGVKERKRYNLTRRKLKNNTDFQYDNYCVYWGCVIIRKDNYTDYFNLKLYNMNSKRLICRILFPKKEKIWDEIHERLESLEEDTTKYVAFFGKIRKTKQYNNVYIYNSNFIDIRDND